MELNYDTDFSSAVIQGNVENFQTLLDDGASINTTLYNNKWSPLHLTAFLNRTDIIKKLIKGKADVNLVNLNGKTPLYLATSQGHLLAAKILKENGSILQTRNNTKDEMPLEEFFHDQERNSRKDPFFETKQELNLIRMKVT